MNLLSKYICHGNRPRKAVALHGVTKETLRSECFQLATGFHRLQGLGSIPERQRKPALMKHESRLTENNVSILRRPYFNLGAPAARYEERKHRQCGCYNYYRSMKDRSEQSDVKLAIVGSPNVGKSGKMFRHFKQNFRYFYIYKVVFTLQISISSIGEISIDLSLSKKV